MLAKDDFKKAQIKQKNVRHTNLLSRRHFEAVPECCAQSLPVAASVTAPLKIPAQFDKLLLSPSSRGNTALQRRYSMAMSPLLPRYVPGVGGPWFTLTGAKEAGMIFTVIPFIQWNADFSNLERKQELV